MSLCHKCSDLVQSAAKENIMKKRKEIQRKYGVNSPEAKEKILTDPFVVMWVPGPPEPVGPKPKFYPPDPCCAEYDLSINMSNGTGTLEPRLYPIPKHLRWLVPVGLYFDTYRSSACSHHVSNLLMKFIFESVFY